jgi:AcrR family transcriptional regulator
MAHTAPTPRLGREEIIDTALDIADRDGIAAVSMHRVAKQLGVGTMTLYTYVEGKDDLLDGMANAALALIELPVDGTWDERIRAALLATRDVADAHPSLAELIMTRAPATDVKRARHEHSTTQLRRAGLSREDADHASHMLWGLIGGMLLGTRTGVFHAAELVVVGHPREEAERACDIEFAIDVAIDGLRERARRAEEAGDAGTVM